MPNDERCATCGQPMTWAHDHRADLSGIDDGPYLPHRNPADKRRHGMKSAAELTEIRARAWATRRAKYGEHGHR